MAECLYTLDELKQFIKDLDLQLNTGVTGSELDSSQTKSNLKFSIRAARDQKQYFKGIMKTCYPSEYQALFGSHAVQFVGRERCR